MKTVVIARILSAVIVIGTLTFRADRVAGQQPATNSVQQAAFSRPTSTDVQHVHFSRQPAQAGDDVEQSISLEMRMTMSMRQANELVGRSQTCVRTSQRRVVTTTAVESGRTSAVKLRYAAATKQVLATDANEAAAESAPQPQPVQGKTYHCRREPGEKGQLVVTDPAGNRPPDDEYEIVSQQMQMVGRRNPLAEFLAGRTIAVGEKLELPNDTAGQLFNLGDRFGKVIRFTLTLQKLQLENGVKCGVFLASVEAASSDSTQMRLEVEGPLVVETDTCRAERISLIGPIAMSDSRGTYSTAYQMIGTGRLNMSIASVYRDAKR